MRNHAVRHQKAKWIKAAEKCEAIHGEHVCIEWVQGQRTEDSKDDPKRFKMRAYTGGPMQVSAYGPPVAIDLAGLTAKSPIPILMNHDTNRIVGHADEVTIGDSSLDLSGIVSGESPESSQVVASSRKGFPWKASVGARPDKMEFVGEGVETKVNGKTFTGPLYVARKSTLGEVSFVAMAADSKTTAKVAASAAFSKKEQIMEPKFVEWLKANGFDPEAITEAQIAALQAAWKATIPAEPKTPVSEPTADPVAEIRARAAAEATRIGKIEAIAAKYPNIAAEKKATLKASAINDGWNESKAELEFMRADRPKGPAIHASQKDISGQVIEAALCQGLGLPKIEAQFKPDTLEMAHSAFHGRLRLQQAIMIAATANGYQGSPGERIHQGNCRDVLEYAMIRAAGTLSLPGVFSNVANKELLAGFTEEDQVWREIAAIRSVSDFKTVTSYRLNDEMEYEELPPGGTMKHGTVGEESYTRQAKTYAKMFSLSRQDIINDDLGAFDDLRTRLGRGAARKFNNVFWAKFINNSTFFTAARGNYITGATTTLLTDLVGLQLGIAAFDSLKSTAVAPATKGKRIGGTPTILLVPPELEAVAMQIYAPIAAADAAKVNPYSGKYRPVKVHQLSDSTFTGYSALAWYLLRSPTILAPIVVSFLDGVQTPIVESADADFNQLGIQFRGYHDFGCDQAEWLCGVKSKGAA